MNRIDGRDGCLAGYREALLTLNSEPDDYDTHGPSGYS
jgi:hypothetical protein